VWQKSERAIVDLVGGLEQSGELPKYVDRDGLIKETINEALGLGPLEDLLADDKLDEIRVDRRDRVLVGKDERDARLGARVLVRRRADAAWSSAWSRRWA
jgi:Flp pilus assembly CpaF family ATPase